MGDRERVLERRRRLVVTALSMLAGCGPEARGAEAPPAVVEAPPPPAAPLDSDGDGVPDERDQCPDVSGTDHADAPGCVPRPCLTVLPPSEIVVRFEIEFAAGDAQVPSSAGAGLDELSDVLREHPELELVIVGHTDSTEPEALSRNRAESVRNALVARGVPALGLTARGVAATQPKESNTTAEGRAKNRRVSFEVVQP
jgi:OOP family OmpA-OmpF porin